MRRYSKRTTAAAQRFLSKYQLSLNALSEPQQKSVLSYCDVRRHALLCYITFGVALLVCLLAGVFYYNTAQSVIESVSQLSVQNETSVMYTKSCFERGTLFGMNVFCVLYLLVMMGLLPVMLRMRYQIIEAFLPSIKPASTDVQSPANDKNP